MGRSNGSVIYIADHMCGTQDKMCMFHIYDAPAKEVRVALRVKVRVHILRIGLAVAWR